MKNNIQSPLHLSDLAGKNGQIFDIQIWSVSDVAKALDVSVGHIYNLTSRKEIPFHKKGKKGRLYFFPEEIYCWLKQG